MESTISTILFWTIASSLITLAIFQYFIYNLIRLHNKKLAEHKSNLDQTLIEKERQILITRSDTQEETMQKISQEIHDNINQVLTLSKINLSNLKSILPIENRIPLENAENLITNAICDLNTISRSLNGDVINQTSLLRILEIECEKINKLGNINIIIECAKYSGVVNSNIELALYRLFQEAIRNSIVHGKATNIEIELFSDKSQIKFKIVDNGKGFDIVTIHELPYTHQGLKNMRRRIVSVDGSINIYSKIGEGTTIDVTIPLSNTNQ
ncbi:sensor histidine kinase [Flavihumibacter sp.]|uniref:sensor histidine kinase n=1 Tax=Flavihumibacter sp. TaxID=1913981 RepID=UPI002FC5D4C9